MSSLFEVGLGESITMLKQVLPLMSQQRIPTIPQKYAVWYDYVSSHNHELRQEIQERLQRGDSFSPDVCRAIYEKYYLDEIRTEVDGIQGAVRETVETVIGDLSSLDEDILRYTEVLDDCGKKFNSQLTQEDLMPLVATLARETKLTGERAHEVEFSLQTMAGELTELRAQVNALSKDSRTDALTGIANRRAFDKGLLRMLQESAEDGQELCLILVDIDHFKRFNDVHGHLVGDLVLRFVAQEMEQCVKGRDLLTRYGGEEFALLLPATPIRGAEMLAESIRAIIEAQVIRDLAGNELDRITISLGVAKYAAGEDSATFVERADACLYKSKSDGRNRVTGQDKLPLADLQRPSVRANASG
jgi:diguanylate cyclase